MYKEATVIHINISDIKHLKLTNVPAWEIANENENGVQQIKKAREHQIKRKKRPESIVKTSISLEKPKTQYTNASNINTN